VYKETVEANDSGIGMEDVGKLSSDRPVSLLHPDNIVVCMYVSRRAHICYEPASNL
jgi:hypothetical protein